MHRTPPKSKERSFKASKKNKKSEDDYFRIRDFEYVQPLYDLAFLLEIGALAAKTEVPKYRTFSLWRAGYSLDGYGTTISRWLDGSIGNDDLDYVPSLRIREYLAKVGKSGNLPELSAYRGEPFARSLRLRSVRGLGPIQIALSVSTSSKAEEWLNQFSKAAPAFRARVAELFSGRNTGPWQSAHLVPPILRFLHAIETSLENAVSWSIAGIDDPFEPITSRITISANVPWPAMQRGIEYALKRERLFRREKGKSDEEVFIYHQMGWGFSVHCKSQGAELRSIQQLICLLDPLGVIHPGQIVSDLHMHTAWSDGSASVNSMATAVVASGLQHFAVTDHSRSCKLQGGLTPLLWLRQANALTLAGLVCPVLHGIEVDILKDGSLDLPYSLLAATGLVVASVHSAWTDDVLENTARLVKAIESGCVDIIAHPTSAIVGKPGVPDYHRLPAEVNWEIVFDRCAQWHVALELNCFPSRLDLPLPLLAQAVAAGCAISLGSDSHARSHLLNIRFGQAALSRLTAPIVLNRLPYAELVAWIAKGRAQRKLLLKSITLASQSEFQFDEVESPQTISIHAHIQPPRKIPEGSRIVGIDLTAGDKATGIAVLDGLSVETCSLTTDAEIIAFVEDKKPAFVSIDSPLGLPGGGDSIDPSAGIVRVAEHDLASVGIPAYPALIDSMKNLTLRGIRLRRAIESLPEHPQVIESYPGAAQDILCIPRKQKSLDLLREGLRRLGLSGVGLETRSHDEMDAITSAIVGRYFESGQFEPMGITSEAQLIVPKVSPLVFERNPVICLAGKTGAGKSVVARYLSVFYGFKWIRTRNLIKELLIEALSAPLDAQIYSKKNEQESISEKDLQDFGALILDRYKQVPLQSKLASTVAAWHQPLVIDSIRDLVDLDRKAIVGRPVLVWFIECNDSLISARLAQRSKSGQKREAASPVDRTARILKDHADAVISNAATLEDLRWRVDDRLFSMINLTVNANIVSSTVFSPIRI